MTLSVGTLDSKIWDKSMITEYLYKCFVNNQPAIIDFKPEGSCAESLGLYKLLDSFCSCTGYPKEQITIKTANLIETHPNYNIVREATYWYEIWLIQDWLKGKTINTGTSPKKHFASFISQTSWARLWISTILSTDYPNKTLLTYHYNLLVDNYNPNRYTGIDDLIRFGCNRYVDAAKFIASCPQTLDTLTAPDPLFNQPNYYPIQHPSNLNLLQYYNDIFVDIISEPNISGNCFLVTEKLWRAVIAKRPFIILSNPNYLDNLKRLGFYTFDSLWSEEYDQFSGADRIRKIEELLSEISLYSINDLEAKLNQVKSILDHNYNQFIKLSYENIDKEFNDK